MANTPVCVECGKEMPYAAKIGRTDVPVCANPECPEYGLLQVGREQMDKLVREATR